MSEEQSNFKVTDRRLFNPDGSPRDVPPEEKPHVESVSSETSPLAEAPSTNQSATTDQRAAASEPQRASAPAETEAELPGENDPASFASFLMSIASNAASSLGMLEHPVTGKREVDLELGKHWIDVLAMLREKTRGNLLPQEQQALEGLLADLRMQYVSLTHNATPRAQTYSNRDITGG